nr:hypothetical protein [Enterococcus sp. 665A]
MKLTQLLVATLLFLAIPGYHAIEVNGDSVKEIPVVASQAKWANVNNIHFTDNFSLFNSGVAQLPLGKPTEINATIHFSGDLEAIKQAQVIFENVGQGIQIDSDQVIQFDDHQKQAQFKFFITLIEPIPTGTTRLFTVKVSDSNSEDNKYLTSYSQIQTVMQGQSAGTPDSPPPTFQEPNTEPSTEPSTEP